jgi:hypothetical protein
MRPMSVEEAYQFAVRLEHQRQPTAPKRSQSNWGSAAPTGSDKLLHKTRTGVQHDKPHPFNSAGWGASEERRPRDSVGTRVDKAG